MMEWKEIPQHPKYEISEAGQIRAKLTGTIKAEVRQGEKRIVLINSPNAYGNIERLDVSALLSELFPSPEAPQSYIIEQKAEEPKPAKRKERKAFDHVKTFQPFKISEEGRANMSKGKTGKKNKAFKGYYVIHGIRYESSRLAAKALGCNHLTILHRLRNKVDGYTFEPIPPSSDGQEEA